MLMNSMSSRISVFFCTHFRFWIRFFRIISEEITAMPNDSTISMMVLEITTQVLTKCRRGCACAQGS